MVPFPIKFSTAEGSQKWEFLEAEKWTIFHGLEQPCARLAQALTQEKFRSPIGKSEAFLSQTKTVRLQAGIAKRG